MARNYASKRPLSSRAILVTVFAVVVGLGVIFSRSQEIYDVLGVQTSGGLPVIMSWEFNGTNTEGWKSDQQFTIRGGVLVTQNPRPNTPLRLTNGTTISLPAGQNYFTIRLSASSPSLARPTPSPRPTECNPANPECGLRPPGGGGGPSPTKPNFGSAVGTPSLSTTTFSPPRPSTAGGTPCILAPACVTQGTCALLGRIPGWCSQPVPSETIPYKIQVIYSVGGRQQSTTVQAVADGQMHEYVANLPGDSQMKISPLTVAFSGLSPATRVQVDWIRLTGKPKPTPTSYPKVTPKPMPTPAVGCVNNLVSYTPQGTCSSGFQYVYFRCSNGYAGQQGGPTYCQSAETWKRVAQEACLLQCVTPPPNATPSSQPPPPIAPVASTPTPTLSKPISVPF